MIELSNEKIERMLHEETAKTEASDTILRCLYTRYMRLFETYFADVDALSEDTVAALRKDHEETKSLIKYYYMDIPLDICKCLIAFDDEYCAKLLGSEWHKYLSDIYGNFKEKQKDKDKSEECLKAAFRKQTLAAFYDAMDYIFRDGFGTGSQTLNTAVNEIATLLFGKEK